MFSHTTLKPCAQLSLESGAGVSAQPSGKGHYGWGSLQDTQLCQVCPDEQPVPLGRTWGDLALP